MAGRNNWQDEYRRRQRSLDEAMALIKEGDLVVLGVLCPAVLADAFQKRAKELERVDFRSLAPREVALFGPEGPRGEKEIELFIGDGLRPAHDAQIATYLPNTFMLGMKAFDSGRDEARMPDVQLVSCSEPNEQGYVHFGPHMWTKKSYAKRCPITIAAIDPHITPVFGDVWMHVSEIHTFVPGVIDPVDVDSVRELVRRDSPAEEQEERLSLLDQASIDQIAIFPETFASIPTSLIRQAFGIADVDPEAQAIADNAKYLVRDGATVQIGIGQPSGLMVVAGALDEAKHLGIHTELGAPGLGRLWAKGIVDGSEKTVHKNKSVAVAWSGCSGEDLKLIADNPAFELYDPDYLLNPLLMGRNHRMTSINSAIAVDLLGQIASEDRFGGHMINGTGGQPDTHISASLSSGGRAITVMRSTAVGGSISKVVTRHEAGTLVTVPRYLADTIVTEYGIARLLDKNHRQRAEELISVAHPDFRAELRREAEELVGSV
ncbi:MAG TPA: acetyl-CoA hydrolase/transferase C-terminal domain-containing protein [Dehalococcoidia bacterium]|nr:acetyl-CoA hydrolase/transferase C-terminal domain-containing protein [Dehalococcoidia bacterium]